MTTPPGRSGPNSRIWRHLCPIFNFVTWDGSRMQYIGLLAAAVRHICLATMLNQGPGCNALICCPHDGSGGLACTCHLVGKVETRA
jgi:hypothetical protein